MVGRQRLLARQAVVGQRRLLDRGVDDELAFEDVERDFRVELSVDDVEFEKPFGRPGLLVFEELFIGRQLFGRRGLALFLLLAALCRRVRSAGQYGHCQECGKQQRADLVQGYSHG